MIPAALPCRGERRLMGGTRPQTNRTEPPRKGQKWTDMTDTTMHHWVHTADAKRVHGEGNGREPVSYTHLTLPTNREV